MKTQLTLNVRFSDRTTLRNFYPGSNEPLLAYLNDFILGKNHNQTYIWGQNNVGKSHLLQACCRELQKKAKIVSYLPLKDHRELSPKLLSGLENVALLAIDGIDAVVGLRHWEEALFHYYNRSRETKSKLLLAANAPPKNISFLLPDLQSRLAAGVVFQLKPLTDQEKILALQRDAMSRGLELSKEVSEFLLTHLARDVAQLFSTLEKLDEASLRTKRRLTIPFVKSVLAV